MNIARRGDFVRRAAHNHPRAALHSCYTYALHLHGMMDRDHAWQDADYRLRRHKRNIFFIVQLALSPLFVAVVVVVVVVVASFVHAASLFGALKWLEYFMPWLARALL